MEIRNAIVIAVRPIDALWDEMIKLIVPLDKIFLGTSIKVVCTASNGKLTYAIFKYHPCVFTYHLNFVCDVGVDLSRREFRYTPDYI